MPFYYADTHTGSPTIIASATVNGTGVAGTTNGFAMTPAAENKLVITHPAAGLRHAPAATVSVGVTLEDQYGNIDHERNTGSNDTIHVALSSGSFAAGTTSVAATNGVANFSGLSDQQRPAPTPSPPRTRRPARDVHGAPTRSR